MCGLPRWLTVKNLPVNAADARLMGLIPGVGRCPGEVNGDPFQYSCWGIPGEVPGGLQSVGSQSDTTE